MIKGKVLVALFNVLAVANLGRQQLLLHLLHCKQAGILQCAH